MVEPTNAEERDWFAEFEALGSAEVRKGLATERFGPLHRKHAQLARHWLEVQERADDTRWAMSEAQVTRAAVKAAQDANQIAAGSLSEMRSTTKWVKWTMVFTGVTAVVAVVALIRTFMG